VGVETVGLLLRFEAGLTMLIFDGLMRNEEEWERYVLQGFGGNVDVAFAEHLYKYV
jgi:hypothetical protein